MDKFINTSNGGIPLVNNDFRWSDASIRDFIDNHLSDFAVTIAGNGNFYLSGVDITYSVPNYVITAGYVYIDGEIVKVDAQTCSPASLLPGEEFRFEVVETYDTTGDKTTRSGASISTYRKRRAVPTIVTSTDPLTDSQLVFALTASQERIQDKIDKLLGSVTYTEQNYVTNGERITDSIDALDVKLKDVSDITDKIKSAYSDTILNAGMTTNETDIVSLTFNNTGNAIITFSIQLSSFSGASASNSITYKIYVNGVLKETVSESFYEDGGAMLHNFTIRSAITSGHVVKVTGDMSSNVSTVNKSSLTVFSVD